MKKNIVIIEDDTATLNIISRILEGDGYTTAKLKALFNLEELIGLNADCFIIDERLPYVNGHIICIMLKSNPVTKDIPVILISSYNDLEGFATLGKADAFLKKPFESAELLQIVSSLFDVSALN